MRRNLSKNVSKKNANKPSFKLLSRPKQPLLPKVGPKEPLRPRPQLHSLPLQPVVPILIALKGPEKMAPLTIKLRSHRRSSPVAKMRKRKSGTLEI